MLLFRAKETYSVVQDGHTTIEDYKRGLKVTERTALRAMQVWQQRATLYDKIWWAACWDLTDGGCRLEKLL
jgi:hypothetical protein